MDSGPPPPPKTTSDVVDEPPQPGPSNSKLELATDEEQPIRLVPLSSSTLLSIKDLLAIDEAEQVVSGFPSSELFLSMAVGIKMIAQKSVVAHSSPHPCLVTESISLILKSLTIHPKLPSFSSPVLCLANGLAASHAIWADRNPTCRMADVEELSGAVILLFSKQTGRYINGADIVVYG
ncbi:hypothetical protein F5880DRAFT_1641138 [Lentinula raphanica]|nr:hypothetical protein F5880DRAFT_1641138 [Lentinula raphanica]